MHKKTAEDWLFESQVSGYSVRVGFALYLCAKEHGLESLFSLGCDEVHIEHRNFLNGNINSNV